MLELVKIEKNTFLNASVAFNQVRNFLISQGAQILTYQEPRYISCRHGSSSSLSRQNAGKKVSINITPSINGSKVIINLLPRSTPFFILVTIWGISLFIFGFTLLLYLFSFIFLELVAIISLIVSAVTSIGFAYFSANIRKFSKDLIMALELPPPPPPPPPL